MKKTIVFVGLLLVLGSIPAVTAEHLSVGYQDGPALNPQETPEDPSVPGTTIGGENTPYGVATQEDCYEPSGEINTTEAQQAPERDSLCGELVYHNGSPLETVSTVDQDLRGPIGQFEVIHTRSYRTMTYTGVAADIGGYSYCAPMCPNDSAIQPVGGEAAWDAFHNAGNQLGLTDPPDEARSKADSDRGQQYAVNLYLPGPGRVVQNQANVWHMNGWMVPHVENTFIGFLENEDGDPIGPGQLEDLVEQRRGDELAEETSARVCAYSPDIELTTVAPGAAGTRCELPFRYRDPGSGEADFQDGYNDRCESPTYVCGAINGPAWYAEFCLCFGFINPAIPGLSPVFGFDNFFVGDEGSQTDYLRWHHFVAPHNSMCNGVQEPGVSFDPGQGHEMPYLAHDVDIYTPVWSLQGNNDTRGIQNGLAYAEHTFDGAVETALDTADNATEQLGQLPGVPGPVEDQLNSTSDTVNNATFLVLKSAQLEPNNAVPVGGLDDTSRSLSDSDLVRSFEDLCSEILSSESSETIDPWVDYIDSQIVGQTLGLEAYGNEDQNQDDSNRPGPNLYSTAGKVGMFTDKDDSGAYEQAPGGTKWEGKTVQQTGAYPMMWDMALHPENGTINERGGCQPSDGVPLPKAMSELGYGPNTGLVQAVYLQEATTFVDSASGNVVPYSAGNNVYLMMSQAARVQYERGDVAGNELYPRIQNLVDSLQAYADAENGDLGEPDVQIPAQQMGLSAAITDQCAGSTGNFDTRLQFTHDCQMSCDGDTVVTMYAFQLTSNDGELTGAPLLPDFRPTGSDAFEFGQGMHTWFDVDPFDNDPDRNDDEENPPPTG